MTEATLPYKLRIRTGASAQSSSASPTEIHRTAGFVVEASGDVTSWWETPEVRVILAGQVDGVRTRAGGWRESSGGRDLAIDPANPARSADKIEGRFVLAVVGPGDRCWVGTDRYGRADVFISGTGSDLTLATDLSLVSSPGNGGYDQPALAHTLVAYGWRAPKRHTAYARVSRLGVGESIEVINGRGTRAQREFVPAIAAPLSTRSLNEYADRLLESVRLRASRHGNVVFLSSGWDSTSILACLVHLFGPRKVRAVIGRMRYADRSGVINQFELDRARAVADYYGVKLEVAEFDYTRTAPAQWDRVKGLFLEHNIASITGLNHFALADHVARTTRGDEAVFAGEISDGAHNLGFSQFVTVFHATQAFREYADKMAGYLYGPTFFGLLQDGKHESDEVFGFLRRRMGQAAVDELAPAGAARTQQLLSSFFLRGTRFPLGSLRNTRVLHPAGQQIYAESMERAYLAEAAQALTPETMYAWYLHLYNSFHWQGSTVATLALTGEAMGLRMALPFWDSQLQDSLSALPEEAGRGLDLHPTKYPLKWTLEHRLDYPFHLQVGPHSYLYDVDPSFSHSAEVLYASSLKLVFREALQTRRYRDVLDESVFDLAYLDSIVDHYLAGDEVRGAELGDLMSLAQVASVGWYGR